MKKLLCAFLLCLAGVAHADVKTDVSIGLHATDYSPWSDDHGGFDGDNVLVRGTVRLESAKRWYIGATYIGRPNAPFSQDYVIMAEVGRLWDLEKIARIKNFYFDVNVGINLDRDSGMEGPLDTARFAFRYERPSGFFVALTHVSHVSAGKPFNDRVESYVDILEIGKQF